MALSPYPILRLKVSEPQALQMRFLPAVTANANGKVDRSGDTMTGPLILFQNPTTDMEAATKYYVDNTSVLSETLVTLTDQVGVPLDASLGNVFHLTATADRTILAPTNAPGVDKTQKIVIRFKASGANRSLSLTPGAGGFRFGITVAALTTTTVNQTDYVGAIWNYADNFWDVVSYSRGF